MKKSKAKKVGLAGIFKSVFEKKSCNDERQFSKLGKLGGRLVIMRATGTLL